MQGRKTETNIENEPVGTVGDEEGGTESITDIYTLPCVKYIASRKLLYKRGSSARWSVMVQRGEMRVEGMGGSSKREGTYVTL